MINREYIEIGNELRKIRQDKGLTLKEASEKIGIGLVFLSEIERAIKVPSTIVIHDIAKVYEIDEPTLAQSYGKTPISVVEALHERKDFLGMVYELKNTSRLSEDEKDEFFKQIVELFNETLTKKEGD